VRESGRTCQCFLFGEMGSKNGWGQNKMAGAKHLSGPGTWVSVQNGSLLGGWDLSKIVATLTLGGGVSVFGPSKSGVAGISHAEIGNPGQCCGLITEEVAFGKTIIPVLVGRCGT